MGFANKLASAAVAVMAAAMVANAQTFTDCNPLKKSCPADQALGTTSTSDFTKGEDQSFFKLLPATSLKYDSNLGAIFSISNENEAPTIASNKYIFFGKLEVVVQAAPGAGVVTSVVLQSDDLDEIDMEWVGSDPDNVQSNYFSKGDTSTYDRGAYHPVGATTSQFHTYTIDWTPEAIVWLVNGNPVRTLTYADAKNGATFPQTPMQIKLGTWIAGKKDNPQGTLDWAGGVTDFKKAPFLAYYKSITVTDYSNSVQGAKQYIYGDQSGTYGSIIVDTKGDGSSDDSKATTATTTTPVKPTTTAKPTSLVKPTSVVVKQTTATADAEPTTISHPSSTAITTPTVAAPTASTVAHDDSSSTTVPSSKPAPTTVSSKPSNPGDQDVDTVSKSGASRTTVLATLMMAVAVFFIPLLV